MIRFRKNNKYREGCNKNDIWSYDSIKRANAYIHNYIKSVSIDP